MSHPKLNKDRVLILVNHDVVIYNFRKELVERLLGEGYEVFISSPQGERIHDLVNMGCKYVEATVERRSLNPIAEHKLLNYYKRIIAEINPGVVLTYTVKPNIYGGLACQKLNVPYIVNITGLGTALENKGFLQAILIRLYRKAVRNAACLFFQNTENRDFFASKKIYGKKQRLIPGSGVNLDHFSVLEYPEDTTINFTFISRIMKEKGIDQFLEAAKEVKARRPDTTFHVCGFCEEPYEERLSQLDGKGIIKYHGMVMDIREILSETHCTVHPTYYPEGISNVLLESAACGRPLITTDRSGCREVVDNGVNGFLVRPKDTQAIVNAICEFLDLDHTQKVEMGRAARRKVESGFDRKTVVDAYMEEIEISNSIRNRYK